MDRRQYLRETSEALRGAEEDRKEIDESRPTRIDSVTADNRDRGTRVLERFAATLRSEGLQLEGDRWQCPSCRSQGREPEFVMEMRVVGKQVEVECARECRPNTIRALLGAPPYFPHQGRAKTVGRYPF